MGENSKKIQPRAGEAAAEWVSLSSLRPWADNPRHNDGKPVEKVAESIKRFGFASPIIARADGEIIAGHTRYKAAQALGLDRVPVRFLDLDPADAHLLAVADNRLGEFAEWDTPKLQEILSDFSFDDAALAGYTQEDFDEWASELASLTVNEDEVPAPPTEPVTRPGDVWTLGRHRLHCGDSAVSASYRELMQGERAKMLLTDPPYNVNYEGGTGLTIANDNMADGDFRIFLSTCFGNSFEVMEPGAAFYVWHADSEGYNFRGAVKDCGQDVRQCLIWVKQSLVLGRQDYQWKHEPCLYGWKAGAGHTWLTDRKQTTVLEFDRPTKSAEHPTMKPVELFAYLISNSARKDELVIDPFLGSGTTLIAAEQLGRRCYGLEISPAYCDVIVERWENLTGGKAKRE